MICNMELFIRSMTHDDIPYVSDLLCDCYRWLGEVNSFSDEIVSFLVSNRGSIEAIVKESAYELYFVACNYKQIVGMVSVHGNRITKLYVDPMCHNNGIGRKLFDKAELIISNDGHASIELETLGESPVRFYESMGMNVTDKKSSRPAGVNEIDVFFMSKELSA
jgi:ribosomal protein S18 acetylase RimI-like enzyme